VANEGQENDNTTTASYVIRCALSKVVFPEICLVCLGEPEVLVAIAVIERPLGEKGDDRTYSTLKRGTSKTDIALEAARGATGYTGHCTFYNEKMVLLCVRHNVKGCFNNGCAKGKSKTPSDTHITDAHSICHESLQSINL
jgi:hypothetical protein